MSLYNNVKASLLDRGIINSLRSGVAGNINDLTAAATSALGGGALASRIANMGGGYLQSQASTAINQAIPAQYRQALNAGGGALGDLLSGDWERAGLRLLDAGLLGSLLPGLLGDLASQAAYWGTPTPLFGGLTPAAARALADEIQGISLSKKNLWLIEVVSSPLAGDIGDRFNLLATELEYAPWTMNGEKRRIGGTTIDCAQGSDPIELRVTTMDDSNGFLRRWFIEHFAAVVAQNGTMGVPADYAIQFKIVHSFLTRVTGFGGYEDSGLFRPVNLDVSLSRREDALQECAMTFTQLDPFVSP